jgi:hypothetical protein
LPHQLTHQRDRADLRELRGLRLLWPWSPPKGPQAVHLNGEYAATIPQSSSRRRPCPPAGPPDCEGRARFNH